MDHIESTVPRKWSLRPRRSTGTVPHTPFTMTTLKIIGPIGSPSNTWGEPARPRHFNLRQDMPCVKVPWLTTQQAVAQTLLTYMLPQRLSKSQNVQLQLPIAAACTMPRLLGSRTTPVTDRLYVVTSSESSSRRMLPGASLSRTIYRGPDVPAMEPGEGRIGNVADKCSTWTLGRNNKPAGTSGV